MADLKNFKAKLFEKAKGAGFEEYELYCQNGATMSVQIFNGEVSQFTNASSVGVSFRGKHGGKMGYASSEFVDDSVIDFLVDNAKQNAGIIESEDFEELYAGDAKYPEVDCYSANVAAASVDAKVEKALKIEKSALDADERVKLVPYCALANGEQQVLIANSKGLDVSRNKNYMYSYAYAQAAEGESVKMGGETEIYSNFDGFDPEKLGKAAAKKALEKLGGKPVPSGKYKVVLDTDTAGNFLAVFFNAFSAEHAQKGFSLLKGKLGEKIASPAVTIVDDPLIPLALGSTPFDSEGVAAYKKTVIDGGTFKTFLHNTKTARKDGVAPTGNGFKDDFNSPVNIGATNFYVAPGEKSAEQLYEQVGDGVLITDLAGLHSGANPVSGEFSLQAEGFVIEGGKKGRPVELITVSGNFFTLLGEIEAVADDLKFGSPSRHGNIASPSLFIRGLDIAGS